MSTCVTVLANAALNSAAVVGGEAIGHWSTTVTVPAPVGRVFRRLLDAIEPLGVIQIGR